MSPFQETKIIVAPGHTAAAMAAQADSTAIGSQWRQTTPALHRWMSPFQETKIIVAPKRATEAKRCPGLERARLGAAPLPHTIPAGGAPQPQTPMAHQAWWPRLTSMHLPSPERALPSGDPLAPRRADARLLGHHDLDELLVVDLAVAVNVRLADHLVTLLVGELLAEVGHDVAELGGGDEPVAVLVEHLEGLDDLLLGVSVLHLASHHGEELGEVDGAVAVGIDLVDHVLQLGLSGVLAQRAHDRAQLLGGDGAVTVLVEQRERLLELGDLLLGKLVRHGLGECGLR